MRTIHKIWPVASALALSLAMWGGGNVLAYNNSQWVPPAGGTLAAWVWSSTNDSMNFIFSTNGSTNTFSMDIAPPSSATVLATWAGGDNPAPLLWYQSHVSPGWLGWNIFGYGSGNTQHTAISAPLIAVMNAERFNPAMVGGYAVSGITTPANSTWSYADSWIYPSGLNASATLKTQGPQVSLTGTAVSSVPPSSTSPAPAPTPSPAAPTHSTSTAPASPTQKSTSSSTPVVTQTPPSTSPAVTAQTTTNPTTTHSTTAVSSQTSHTAPSASSHAVVVPTKPIEPSHQARHASYHHYRQALTAEAAHLHGSSAPTSKPWPWVGLGVVIVAGGGVSFWQWRRHRG